MTAPSSVDRLRQAIADTLSIDAQGLQAAIGQLVVATSADYPAAGPEDRSLYSAAVRTTALLADRIPAGQEAQALAQEIERHHGRQAAQAVIGERVGELLGNVSNCIDPQGASKRYALARHGADAGLMWSVGGVWRASLPSWPETLMTGSEVDAFQKRHPNAYIVDVLVYREAHQAYISGVNSVIDHNERSTPETRRAAHDAGVKALARAGFPEDALDVIKATRHDGQHAAQTAQDERDTMLLGQIQAAMADKAFEAYNFGEGMAVVGVSGWEYYAAGHERSCAVYMENVINDGKENPSTQLGFTVRYDPETGALAEAYADDATGVVFGCMPEGQMEKLNAEAVLSLALEKLVPHVLHYASMPHAHSDADRDAANARKALADTKGGAKLEASASHAKDTATNLGFALGKLIPHVLHYASMPKAHSGAHRDVADARKVLAEHLQAKAPDLGATGTNAMPKGAVPASQKMATAELTGLAFDWAVATATGRVVSGSFVYRDFNGHGLHEYSIKAPAAAFSPWRDQRTLERVEAKAGAPVAELLRQKFGQTVDVPTWVVELHNEQLEIDGRVSALRQQRVGGEEVKPKATDESSPAPGM